MFYKFFHPNISLSFSWITFYLTKFLHFFFQFISLFLTEVELSPAELVVSFSLSPSGCCPPPIHYSVMFVEWVNLHLSPSHFIEIQPQTCIKFQDHFRSLPQHMSSLWSPHRPLQVLLVLINPRNSTVYILGGLVIPHTYFILFYFFIPLAQVVVTSALSGIEVWEESNADDLRQELDFTSLHYGNKKVTLATMDLNRQGQLWMIETETCMGLRGVGKPENTENQL